ncbi:GMC oxidoreductase [Ilyonectria robusta]|uniref:GMC oxidoreductase n=1 Tax=Ilyonectria robusta TaxID=1079257 RepID=UPI001E8EBD45|nr:GMC oxidoreductase [Ilyonectria robusta]KAH8664925.1 GMC oxidoreductase [Ilyonectria robusta]
MLLWDYIVVGGGLAGSVISNRLLERNPSLKILLVEAGINANDRQDIVWPNSTNGQFGDFDWAYYSEPQSNLNNRSIASNSGKGLGGSTLINGAFWVRGHTVEYDQWAGLVGDDRWSYKGQLLYMRKTETFMTNDTDLEQHGLDGNVKIQNRVSTNRTKFPMREPLLKSWEELGAVQLPRLDGNMGEPIGIAEAQENRDMGRRQQASLVYSLDGITVLTETMVAKVITTTTTNGTVIAQGIELANGTEIYGSETILTAGAYRTPQILMLSGIGPAETLEKYDIPVVLNQPDVGQHLHDHPIIPTFWRLKDPSAGYARESGASIWDEPQYDLGLDIDFLTTLPVPKEGLAKAIAEDEGETPDPDTHPLLKQDRAHVCHVVQYSGGSTDGSALFFMTLMLVVQAEGSVTISSADINDEPVIDPNFLGTATDRYALREAIRTDIRLMTSNETVIGREIISGEVSNNPLTIDSTDDEIDARIRENGAGCYHPSGTASMGKVVDTDLRVKGISGLRIADTSVIPLLLSANLQIATYALAEQAAVILEPTSA